MGLPNDQIYYPKNPNPSELPMQTGFQGVGNFLNKPMPKGPSEIPMQQDFMGTGGPKPKDKFENPSNIPTQPGFGSFGNFFNKPNIPKGPSEIPMEQDFMGQNLRYDLNQDGIVDMLDFYEIDSSNMTPQQFDQFVSQMQNIIQGEIAGSDGPGFLEQLFSTSSPLQFTGGGGQGGQAARQLYFPGTSGGFAGVGSGIDSSMLQNLLNRG